MNFSFNKGVYCRKFEKTLVIASGGGGGSKEGLGGGGQILSRKVVRGGWKKNYVYQK